MSLGAQVDTSMDYMGTAREQAEHMGSIDIVNRLAKDLMIEADDGVSGENDIVCRGCKGLRFFGGKAANELDGRFTSQKKFGDICRLDNMVDAGGKEKFVAAWGGGGEDEHFSFRVARRKEVAAY